MKLDLNEFDEIIVSEEDFSPTSDRKDYEVHLKYVQLIKRLSKGLSASHALKAGIDIRGLKDLDSKLRIIERTNQLLEEQIRCVNDDVEYARASVAWLPAQVYYNLYHLLAIIEYLVSGDKTDLRIPHEACLRKFANRIAAGSIKFSCSLFNQAYDKQILRFKSQSGEVLSTGIADERLVSLVMKKIGSDKLKDYKTRSGLDCRKSADRQRFNKQQNGLMISVVDFFYSMRIRTNYRDMSFLDDIEPERTRKYFLEYHQAAKNFYDCLDEIKADLILQVQ